MILLTGATGFVGQALLARLAQDGRAVRAVSRRRPPTPAGPTDWVAMPDLGPDNDWRTALAGVEQVVHTAARVHVMHDTAADPLAEFRRANVEGTLALARQAAAAGVRRFVFVSSVKVHGEATAPGQPFRASDTPAPQDAYGLSKWEAEQGLHAIAQATGMAVVIVRPPLVYGPGVQANFAALMRWLARGRPLPLGRVRDNRRSLVALGNLVDLLCVCLDHPAAAGQTFLVSDGEDLSTQDLLRRLGQALGRPAQLWPVPVLWLRLAAAGLGRGAAMQRLSGSLQLDITPTCQRLGWRPPVSVDQGLRLAAEALRQRTRS
ncbi:SDR family oxidoreductase [Curvibacter sp. HBC28]|uniref:SDR family oxidoreductase n=1 Tax=Curvibacter microcysteis TaxID=3026419 RepID=A0ABT5MJN2_9BURK|nr:SDR family oxidoreductase [Curvibacter sp. HBC28]MDD0815400.1 SDR family oxidoreductase [Curvibacter sp. HBC28]